MLICQVSRQISPKFIACVVLLGDDPYNQHPIIAYCVTIDLLVKNCVENPTNHIYLTYNVDLETETSDKGYMNSPDVLFLTLNNFLLGNCPSHGYNRYYLLLPTDTQAVS